MAAAASSQGRGASRRPTAFYNAETHTVYVRAGGGANEPLLISPITLSYGQARKLRKISVNESGRRRMASPIKHFAKSPRMSEPKSFSVIPIDNALITPEDIINFTTQLNRTGLRDQERNVILNALKGGISDASSSSSVAMAGPENPVEESSEIPAVSSSDPSSADASPIHATVSPEDSAHNDDIIGEESSNNVRAPPGTVFHTPRGTTSSLSGEFEASGNNPPPIQWNQMRHPDDADALEHIPEEPTHTTTGAMIPPSSDNYMSPRQPMNINPTMYPDTQSGRGRRAARNVVPLARSERQYQQRLGNSALNRDAAGNLVLQNTGEGVKHDHRMNGGVEIAGDGTSAPSAEKLDQFDRDSLAKSASDMDNALDKLAEPFIEGSKSVMAATGTKKEDINSLTTHIPGALGYVPKYLGAGPEGRLKGDTYWNEANFLDIRTQNPMNQHDSPLLTLAKGTRDIQRHAMSYGTRKSARYSYGHTGYSRVRDL